MVNLDLLKKSIPVAPIKIAALQGCEELANTVNDYLVEYRKALSQEKTPLPGTGTRMRGTRGEALSMVRPSCAF